MDPHLRYTPFARYHAWFKEPQKGRSWTCVVSTSDPLLKNERQAKTCTDFTRNCQCINWIHPRRLSILFESLWSLWILLRISSKQGHGIVRCMLPPIGSIAPLILRPKPSNYLGNWNTFSGYSRICKNSHLRSLYLYSIYVYCCLHYYASRVRMTNLVGDAIADA